MKGSGGGRAGESALSLHVVVFQEALQSGVAYGQAVSDGRVCSARDREYRAHLERVERAFALFLVGLRAALGRVRADIAVRPKAVDPSRGTCAAHLEVLGGGLDVRCPLHHAASALSPSPRPPRPAPPPPPPRRSARPRPGAMPAGSGSSVQPGSGMVWSLARMAPEVVRRGRRGAPVRPACRQCRCRCGRRCA